MPVLSLYNRVGLLYNEYMSYTRVTKSLYNRTEHISIL